jgi:hypothetical protein
MSVALGLASKAQEAASKEPGQEIFFPWIFSTSVPCRLASHSFLSNYSIRSRQHVWGNGQADLLGGFEIDDELEFRWLLDGKICGLSSFQDLVYENRGVALQVG